MSRLTLKLRNPLSQRIDVSAISPDRLAGIPVDSISRLPMYVGKQKVELGELFSVNGSDSENIVFAGGANLDRVGQGMSHGSVRVDGDAGAYAGALREPRRSHGLRCAAHRGARHAGLCQPG